MPKGVYIRKIASWNKGRKIPEQELIELRKKGFGFKKGVLPWNKGLKLGDHPGILEGSSKRKMETHWHWKGGKMITGYGYVLIKSPDHPRQTRGYVFEHIIVMEKHLGRQLKKGEVAHHINEIKSDNRIENLKLMNSKEHKRYHALEKNRNEKGQFQ